MTVGLAAVAVSAAATLVAPPVVTAEPAAPQPGTPCSETVAGALTQLPDFMTVLQCGNQRGGEYRWQTFDSPTPTATDG